MLYPQTTTNQKKKKNELKTTPCYKYEETKEKYNQPG